jgi:NAD(P)-dependent dehydrogenase (short-subunit alcohol dehydrogenase family)
MNRHLAVITGCSSGFGLLSTVELARQGWTVVATMRDLNRRGALDEAITRAGVGEHVSVRQLDATAHATHKAFVESVLADYGRIDLLVNNAGFAMAGFVEDLTLEEYRRQFETNFFGMVSLTKEVLPAMRQQRSGRIVNISSIAGRTGTPAMSAYNASKFAMEGYTEALRLEMAPIGVFPILIEPGSFETGIWYHKENVAAAAADPNSPNTVRSGRFRDYIQQSLQRADANDVARLIAHVASVPDPKLRYPIGKDAKLLLVLRLLLPWKAFESLVVKKMGLGL